MEGTLQYISGFRSRIGVQQNRLEHTADNESNDWEGFLMGLRAARFEGTLSFETAPVLTAFPEKLKREALAFPAEIGNYNWKLHCIKRL
ncbi:hypothetical protein [uncultured Acetatifactor sp.]|uniref:hypothetical protein n=1 Tax=uncultured Acetatifactor sp. TaxID=1671927 RepID=UPI0026333FDB|nr:hypothetical protein [uncultured Acetatifactor sp.]